MSEEPGEEFSNDNKTLRKRIEELEAEKVNCLKYLNNALKKIKKLEQRNKVLQYTLDYQKEENLK